MYIFFHLQSTVEKLYIKGIKQLETFNDMNEKFVQLLNMIPDPKVSNLLQCIAIISAT